MTSNTDPYTKGFLIIDPINSGENPMKLINATPHQIVLLNEIKEPIATFEPSGIIPRCSVNSEKLPNLKIKTESDTTLSIQISKSVLGDVVGLPPYEKDVFWIVSMVVAQKAKDYGRDDLLVPDAVRNDSGFIIGCRGFLKP